MNLLALIHMLTCGDWNQVCQTGSVCSAGSLRTSELLKNIQCDKYRINLDSDF